jgi:hypothetical protein
MTATITYTDGRTLPLARQPDPDWDGTCVTVVSPADLPANAIWRQRRGQVTLCDRALGQLPIRSRR